MPSIARKATREQTKSHNKRLILKTIYDQAPLSRADVARITHLTRPTVSSTVTELIDEGLVAEVGHGQSEGGKPPILLSVVDDSRHLIGLDLANSEFRGAVIDLRGNVVHRESILVNDHDGQDALELVYELNDRLIATATSPLLGMGIGTPGLVDAQGGIVRKAVNLNWEDLPLGNLLESRYNLPVYVANDSHAAALGAYTFEADQETVNLILVKVGRGVGAGVVLNGRPYYGDGSGAGEIGHVRVSETNVLCRCGHFGCLDAMVSSRAVVKRAKAIAKNNPHSLLHRFAPTPEAINIQVVQWAFEAGEAELQPLVTEIGCYLGVAVANLIGAFNIQRILISGSVSGFGEALLEPIRREVKQRALGLLVDKTEIGLSNLDQDIVVLGAAALLFTQELGVV